MDTRFRALRWVASLYRIFAWILLVVGILFAGLLIVLGAVQESVGAPSPILENVPVLRLASNLPGGILTGLGILALALVQFLMLYAGSEAIRLALSIEQSAREAALYLRGESLLPPLPQPAAWSATPESSPERN
jgi:hypothetical protein